MANLYTKTGDKGETGLVGGSRVSKASPRVDCYGTIDEANSMLGIAYAQTAHPYIRETIHRIQGRLFALGAELASDEKGLAKLSQRISDKDVMYLEEIVDTCTETTGRQTAFVIPGADPSSSALHAARTIVRRAERAMVRARATDPMEEVLFQYVNRLSDAIYALARLAETEVQKQELQGKVEAVVKEKLRRSGVYTQPFTLETIQKMARRAEEKAAELKVPIVFSAVDEGGNLILLHRMEGALLASVDIAMNKAYTASAFKMPTDELGRAACPGGPLYGVQNTGNGRVVIFGGGFPYRVHGRVAGAIGVSGGTVEEDMLIAGAALEWF